MLHCRVIFPPQFEPFQVYLSGPYLKALLRQFDIDSTVFDANIDFYEWLVSKAGGAIDWPVNSDCNSDYLHANVKNALRVLKREPASLLAYRWAVNVVDEYLNKVSPVGTRIGLTYLKVGNRYSTHDLNCYLRRADNIFSRYFEHAAESLLGPQDVTTYLLSLVVIDQLAAAVAFAREIKARRPGTRILIGGPLVSRLHHQLTSVEWIRQTFDAIIPGEAYRVLPAALGLSHRYSDHITPDFSDIDLDRYWSCKRVLPYIVAHGCKWGKCTFCSHHLTYDGYRSSGMDEVLEDLDCLSKRHQTEYFSFCDEYLTPSQLVDLSAGISAKCLEVKWSTFARPEPQYRDPTFMKVLYTAGCRMLMFGLESGSQKILNAMKKGTRVVYFRPILEACKEARISIRYDFMVGFPTETEEDVSQTYAFIDENRDVIDTPFSSYSVAVFELRRGIPVLEQGERWGLGPKHLLRGDLDDQYYFESVGGLSEEAKCEWRSRLIRLSKLEMAAEIICPQNKTHQLVLKDLYDKGVFELPVVAIKGANMKRFAVSMAHGVEWAKVDGALRIVNRANGGELEADFRLCRLLECLSTKTVLLDEAYSLQTLWSEEVFIKFIVFLYRNDYLAIWSIAAADNDWCYINGVMDSAPAVTRHGSTW